MTQITGIGGVFLTSPEPDRLRAWYKEMLGLDLHAEYGLILPYSVAQTAHGPGAMGVLAVWPEDSDYIKPATRDAVINFMVDDLDTMIGQLTAKKAQMVGDPVVESYGKFAWVMDPDGRKIELWQPTPPPPAD